VLLLWEDAKSMGPLPVMSSAVTVSAAQPASAAGNTAAAPLKVTDKNQSATASGKVQHQERRQ